MKPSELHIDETRAVVGGVKAGMGGGGLGAELRRIVIGIIKRAEGPPPGPQR
jgi:hypothetical protein